MLQDIDPISNCEGGCQQKEEDEFCQGDTEQEEIGKPSAKHFSETNIYATMVF